MHLSEAVIVLFRPLEAILSDAKPYCRILSEQLCGIRTYPQPVHTAVHKNALIQHTIAALSAMVEGQAAFIIHT